MNNLELNSKDISPGKPCPDRANLPGCPGCLRETRPLRGPAGVSVHYISRGVGCSVSGVLGSPEGQAQSLYCTVGLVSDITVDEGNLHLGLLGAVAVVAVGGWAVGRMAVGGRTVYIRAVVVLSLA